MFLGKKNITNSKNTLLIICIAILLVIGIYFINKITIPSPSSLKEHILNKSDFI